VPAQKVMPDPWTWQSHTTNECRTMQKQAYWMKEAWKNVPQAEQSCQKWERKQQKQKDKN
jgi:hypothetical protein